MYSKRMFMKTLGPLKKIYQFFFCMFEQLKVVIPFYPIFFGEKRYQMDQKICLNSAKSDRVELKKKTKQRRGSTKH